MINKESFVKIMNSVRDYYDELHVEMDRLNVVFEDNYLTGVVDNVIDALIDDMESGIDDASWICSFAWDLDFGRSAAAEGCVKIDEKKYSLQTAEELYDLIMMLKE